MSTTCVSIQTLQLLQSCVTSINLAHADNASMLCSPFYGWLHFWVDTTCHCVVGDECSFNSFHIQNHCSLLQHALILGRSGAEAEASPLLARLCWRRLRTCASTGRPVGIRQLHYAGLTRFEMKIYLAVLPVLVCLAEPCLVGLCSYQAQFPAKTTSLDHLCQGPQAPQNVGSVRDLPRILLRLGGQRHRWPWPLCSAAQEPSLSGC